MHDTIWFEFQQVPSVFLASSAFEDAADVQARALGLPDVKSVFVQHPIQDATDEEMVVRADAAFDAVWASLFTH